MRAKRGRRYEEHSRKLNFKKVIGVVIAIAVIIMIIISINTLLNRENNGLEHGKEYFSTYIDNKWGVIDSNGNIVISPAYDEMIVIPDSTQAVFICTYDMNYETGEFKTKVINEEEEILFSDYEMVVPIDNYDENKNIWYEKNILKAKKDGKYGLINFKGQEILKCEYDNIYSLKNIENSLILEKDGKVGLASGTGDVIINADYSEIRALRKRLLRWVYSKK